MNVRIELYGTPEEMMEVYARFLKRALREMHRTTTLNEAKQVWTTYPAFQNNQNFIDAKDKAKKRLKK